MRINLLRGYLSNTFIAWISASLFLVMHGCEKELPESGTCDFGLRPGFYFRIVDQTTEQNYFPFAPSLEGSFTPDSLVVRDEALNIVSLGYDTDHPDSGWYFGYLYFADMGGKTNPSLTMIERKYSIQIGKLIHDEMVVQYQYREINKNTRELDYLKVYYNGVLCHHGDIGNLKLTLTRK